MSGSLDSAVVAIDGGGSRCRVACGSHDRVVTVETGPANVHSDFDGALREISLGIAQLATRLDVAASTLASCPAFVGLAGVTGPRLVERLRAALPFETLRIEDDRPAALKGALAEMDGVIAHCGTGSFLGVQRDGQMRFAGGWGSVLGDQASAQWIGRRALSGALEASDGTRAMTRLSRKLIDEQGGTDGVVAFAAKASPAEFGALAPVVTSAAEQGDPLAASVMQSGAHYLEETIRALGWTPGMALCLTGGVGPKFRAFLPSPLIDAIQPARGEPLEGALHLARELQHEHC